MFAKFRPDKDYFSVRCVKGEGVNICGGKAYNSEEKFCYDKTIYDKCGGETYPPYKAFCDNDEIYSCSSLEDERCKSK